MLKLGAAFLAAVTLAGAAVSCADSASATGMSVLPTTLAVQAPRSVATLTVQSNGSGSAVLAGQVRVLRWLQQNGKEQLVPTRDVVASPPALHLDPGKQMTVRIVRTLRSPVVGEECYRVLVDQLPGAEQEGVAVKFAIRQSIPLCFDAAKQAAGEVSMSLGRSGRDVVLKSENAGQRRAIVSAVKIVGQGGAKAFLKGGGGARRIDHELAPEGRAQGLCAGGRLHAQRQHQRQGRAVQGQGWWRLTAP